MSSNFYHVRVELHKPHHSEDAYIRLHEKMEKAGYQVTVRARDGAEYHLPRATYLKSAPTGQASAISNEVLAIAESVAAKGHAGVMVSESVDLQIRGLKKVEKATLSSQIKVAPTKVPATTSAGAPKILFSQFKAQQEKK
ncbi:hypothetical protein C798_25390 [Herbaspirillum rubrisubalbicans Os34]|uniref:Uncharacterized protein n=1 Tax=Herbaspirillum rubrisubalbicans Os34 TaxID=1235827 RepID=A0A6M3ZXQ1_9BURK|nr:hypothetical protein [Herbaspirillum rubrisubalbicans]QJQ03449.1 hypothetical protein C798_25390 [Herbaspirillum rubrisubalbicans Os34]